jgi:hypothetical protein
MNDHPSPQQLDQPESPDQPGRAARRPRRPRLLRRAALAVTCLAGAGTLMLAASGTAFATLDQTSPQWAELGPDAYTGGQTSQVTAVYTIQNVAESGTEMLEDNGNNMNAGGTVDVWSQIYQTTNQDTMSDNGSEITQANYLWEYVPQNASAGGSILDGPGVRPGSSQKHRREPFRCWHHRNGVRSRRLLTHSSRSGCRNPGLTGP